MKKEDFKPGIFFRVDTDPSSTIWEVKKREGLITMYAQPVNGGTLCAVITMSEYKVNFSTIIMGQRVAIEVPLKDIQLLTIKTQ